MGFNSFNNRKPFERASLSNHSQIIQNKYVQDLLEQIEVPIKDLESIQYPSGHLIDLNKRKKIRHVISIDGGYSETYIEKGFPSASVAFFNFGALLFDMDDLEKMEESYIINPSDLKKLKEIDKITLVIPSKNLLLKDSLDFTQGVRKTIFYFFSSKQSSTVDNKGLITALKWLIFKQWENQEQEKEITLDFCPNEGCTNKKIVFKEHGSDIINCPNCKKPVFLTDYFRFHEVINEPNGASGIFGYLTSLVEQIILVELIKYFYEMKKEILEQIVFIKDGPLAFFGQTFRLHKPMRNLMKHLIVTENKSLINLVGIEKSGPFVEHALHIKKKLDKNNYYILNDDYIKKYITPPTKQGIYGHNTYYGSKVIYKTENNEVLVLSVPVNEYIAHPTKDCFSNIDVVLSVLAKMNCNMYENSLVPLALINKLVSISEFPSSKLLERFSKGSLNK